MCLAIPGQIVEMQPDGATIDTLGVRKRISLALTPSAQVGDWVLVHAGFAIEVVDADEAAQTIEIVRELGELATEELAASTAETEAVRS
ncbi:MULTISPECIES: HypC/HybG/HupF family hydrogenase formation chaperone [Enorma]|uniref:Hydrogenase assembly protein HypC n=1 Tax=[Collinsella] massiliensis TaxID=1232426 RepID=A0A1Y3XNR4_9ACTN|nr:MULTISPECIES: HypC/HybG/HupF family hydrogenase formation chaperone [Enorma]OUN86751.1 hydrogenase assembly protein HypC [[Collinsella] massiliensis]